MRLALWRKALAMRELSDSEKIDAILERIEDLEPRQGRWMELRKASNYFGFGNDRELRPFKRFLKQENIRIKPISGNRHVVDCDKINAALEAGQVPVQ